MATVHTTARGTEPYDKVYCLGYQVHHEDWSPYPRINKLRQTFLDRGYDVDVAPAPCHRELSAARAPARKAQSGLCL